MATPQKDNSTLRSKVSLRLRLLREIQTPVVMETHGGFGRIYLDCYSAYGGGVVFEKDSEKAEALAMQRPTWAVYECDCIQAIKAGAGAHLAVNFLDVDPYGDPWPVLEAFFSSRRPRPPRVAVAVNDGLRQNLALKGGWDIAALQGAVSRWGAARMFTHYAEICAELLTEKAALAGYAIRRWNVYYTGFHDQMTHYGAILEQA